MFKTDDLKLTLNQTPRADYVLVVPLVKATRSEILLMDEEREQPQKGVVVSVGPGGVGAETGRPIPVLAQLGDLVAYGRYAGLAFDVPGDVGPVKTLIMRDCEILLSQPAGTYELEVHDGDPRKMHEVGLTCEHCPKADLSEERARLLAETGRAVDLDAPLSGRTAVEQDQLIEAERARLVSES